MKKFKNLERLLPHMDAAFTSFYERMLGDVRMSVFFKDAQQITNLIAMQKKHLIQSLTLSQDEMRKSYIKLGEYHYDIRMAPKYSKSIFYCILKRAKRPSN
jgi:hypothetical protein